MTPLKSLMQSQFPVVSLQMPLKPQPRPAVALSQVGTGGTGGGVGGQTSWQLMSLELHTVFDIHCPWIHFGV